MADHTQLQDGAVDPHVRIPKSVIDAAAAADAVHKAVYEAPPVAPPDPAPPAPAATPATPPVQQDPAPPAADPAPPAPTPEDENSTSFKQKFLSMQGRWNAAQRQIGERDELINQLSGELRATQQLLEQNSSPARTSQPHTATPHEKLITTQDVDNYGTELIDVVQRAAREAVAPELDVLRNENSELKKRVITTDKRTLRETLTQQVPNWTEINRSPEFLHWLSLRNIYTGQLRRQTLNDAYQAANAAVVVQMFKDFLMEAKATGSTFTTSQPPREQPAPGQVPAPAPRQPAMDLGTLAAPGRARPAPGDAQVPAEKPIYTRAQISQFYRNVRLARSAAPSGPYVGREAEIAQTEADIIQAQSEGRVRS